MKYYLIAGEASGDLHASHLMQSLKKQDAAAEFRFFGGDLMTAVGGTRVRHYKDLAYMGFIPVLLHLPTILRYMRMCKQDILQWNPDVVILVDYPGFNLKIAKFVKQETKIPVLYYIAPNGHGRSTASRISDGMLMLFSRYFPLKWISLRRNIIIRFIMWGIPPPRKYESSYKNQITQNIRIIQKNPLSPC